MSILDMLSHRESQAGLRKSKLCNASIDNGKFLMCLSWHHYPDVYLTNHDPTLTQHLGV